MLPLNPRLAVTVLATSLLTSTAASAQEPPAPDKPAERPTERDDTWKSPAKGADPLIWPAKAPDVPPTSTSGTAVEGTTPSATPMVVVTDREAAAAAEARVRALEGRLSTSEHQLQRLEDRVRWLKNLTIEAFVQPQLLVQSFNTAASPNLGEDGRLPPGISANDAIAKTDGTTTNGTFFRVRRARLRTKYETESMRLFLQLDALPAGGVGPGIGTILRNAEATGIAHWSRDVLTEFTAGLFFTPFRRELLEPSLERPFIERTWFVQNVFPIERDYGAHAKTIAFGEHLVVDAAIVNGQTLGQRTFVALPDLNRSKDFIGYVTYQIGFVTLGVSGYFGTGQIVDPAALRFKQFSKWAVNYQASVDHSFIRDLGESRLSAEFTVAQNMDSGVIYPFAVPRIPTDLTTGVASLDERAFYVRFEQDLGRRITAGYRFDTYTPETAIKNNARDTHAFLLVGKLSRNLRWMNELDWAIDNVHRPELAPPSKHIVTFSSVLQAMF